MSAVDVDCPRCGETMALQSGDYECQCGESVSEARICPFCGAIDHLVELSHKRAGYEKSLFCDKCCMEFEQ